MRQYSAARVVAVGDTLVSRWVVIADRGTFVGASQEVIVEDMPEAYS